MTEADRRDGVLIVGFGGPDSLDSVAPFMENLMGREPSEDLVAQVRMRYLAIGGSSPLLEIASSIAEKLEAELAEAGHAMPVAVGMRYWHPSIEDAIAHLKEQGVTRVIIVSLSPFESKVAQQAYREEIARVVDSLGGLEVIEAPLISEMPAFVDYMAGGMATAIDDMFPSQGIIVAFTAHSLPVDELVENDPYVAGLRRVAEDVARAAGMGPGHENAGFPMFRDFRAFGSSDEPRAWYLVYQSKGRKPGDWLGPDLDQLIEAAADSEARGIVVCPIGFATDHMETLYDLDIMAADKAMLNDLEFSRSPVPDDDFRLVSAISDAIINIIG